MKPNWILVPVSFSILYDHYTKSHGICKKIKKIKNKKNEKRNGQSPGTFNCVSVVS